MDKEGKQKKLNLKFELFDKNDRPVRRKLTIFNQILSNLEPQFIMLSGMGCQVGKTSVIS